jgi:polyvinyl alcohol dehydrogenase (cytochrome)
MAALHVVSIRYTFRESIIPGGFMRRAPFAFVLILLVAVVVVIVDASSSSMLVGATPIAQAGPDGAAVFEARCSGCHTGDDLELGTPAREDLADFSPNFILDALNEGVMTLQAQGMSIAERVAVAEFLTDQLVVDQPVQITTGLCTDQTPMVDPSTMPFWNGWGPDSRNARFQPDAGLTGGDAANLTLKWAFGLPGETQARAQPAIAGGRLFTGSQGGSGAVYALDAQTGCTYWTFQPQAGVRSAFSIGPLPGGDAYAVYFVDRQANAYAVNADTGQQIWSTQVEDSPAVRGTGPLTLHEDLLFVPMTGVTEENSASNPDYECCRFRGSITALNTTTGEVVWKTYTVPEPQRRGTSTTGVPLWGPAGVGIWSAPTVDPERGMIYAATGNGYADPPQPTADAVIALDIESGEIQWVNQLLPGDTWIGGCQPGSDNPNCPQDIGPDFDFSASPLLATTSSGRDLLVVPQKSGMAYALDPDNEGETVWEYRAGPGSGVGGVWGAAAGDGLAYVAVGGYFRDDTGGIHAIDLETGERVWFTPPQTPICEGGRGCSAVQSAAVTAVPGGVFSGSADGGMRFYSAEDGSILWTFDANRDFETNNGVPANGGSFDGSGPVVAGGMVYMLSGNGGFVGSAGNVLLAFEVN